MITKTINLTAEEQVLTAEEVLEYASNTVDYVETVFNLGTGWEDLDVVRAIFKARKAVVACILDHGACMVPPEVLRQTGIVEVNLAGSVYESGELVERITTAPATALMVTRAALVDDGNAVTPTEFEQFVARVEAAAAKSTEAEAYAERAEAAAEYAEEAAGSAVKVKNMTVSVETLAAGSDATITKTESEEAFDIHFGIPTGLMGPQGIQGIQGETGNGIANAVLNADYTLTIAFTDGTSYTTPPIRGEQGARGIQGETGDTGATGNGIANAVLNADYTLTLTFTDGTSYTTPSIRGATGETGATGATGNGIASAVLNSDYTLTLTFTDGTSYTTGSIRGAQGETGTTGPQGPPGDDYVLTAADKADIADLVIAELPTWTGGAY